MTQAQESGRFLLCRIGSRIGALALNAQLLLVLEAARLVSDSLWSAIEAPGAPA
jgi:hypothetical protein